MNAPYILFAFDIAPGTPNAAAILQDLEANFPQAATPFTSLGVENVFVHEVKLSQALPRLILLSTYFRQKDAAHGGVVRWVVQLCRSQEASLG